MQRLTQLQHLSLSRHWLLGLPFNLDLPCLETLLLNFTFATGPCTLPGLQACTGLQRLLLCALKQELNLAALLHLPRLVIYSDHQRHNGQLLVGGEVGAVLNLEWEILHHVPQQDRSW